MLVGKPKQNVVEFDPDDLLSIEQVAERLHVDIAWVREKIRRRCPNPMPVHNLGRHLLFSWTEVCEWINNSPRPKHAPHIRHKKKPASISQDQQQGYRAPSWKSLQRIVKCWKATAGNGNRSLRDVLAGKQRLGENNKTASGRQLGGKNERRP